MIRGLTLRFRGPLLSFGTCTVGSRRVNDPWPSKSMVAGLLGAAAGVPRSDMDELQRTFEVAFVIDSPGTPLFDYQTFRIGPEDVLWLSDGSSLSRDSAFKGGGYSAIRRKEYLQDCAVRAFVFAPEAFLTKMEEKLENPVSPLFVGRASALPSEPVFAGECLEGETIESAVLEAVGAEPRSVEIPHDNAAEKCGWTAFERKDLRNWASDTHMGSRLVLRTVSR